MTDSELMRLSEQVGLALKARGATVTTAESCTGGWLAKAEGRSRRFCCRY